MLRVDVSDPSEPSPLPTLSDLSRNSSVISSSSSSSATSLVASTPRPRPIRTFSSPRSLSRDAPPTPRSTRPPAYLAKELGLADDIENYSDLKKRAQSRSKSRARTKSRNSSAGFKLDVSDFEFGEILGEGSYSTVVHAIYPPTEQEYAIKILEKAHLKRVNKTQTAIAEKNTLVRLGSGHPGIVRLHWAFHDEWSLYFVLDLARNGELQTRISRLGSLSIPCARYYAAQLVDAVAYMHSRGVIHRDLKPENMLLDDHMRLKITDFGTGKLLEEGSDRAGTFVGTAQYVSPELLTANNTSKASDVWAVGCIIFQMIAGKFPFHALSEYLMWQKVKSLDYTFPDGFDEVAKDLVQKLLVIDPSRRLGAGESGTPYDMDALRRHPFFKDISWETLWSDPAPPMEAGLVKKEHHISEHNYDVGLAWEQLVGNMEDDDDTNAPWVDDNTELVHGPGTNAINSYPFVGSGGEIGPHDIVPQSVAPSKNVILADQAESRGRLGLSVASAGVPNGIQQSPQVIDIPSPSRDIGARDSIVSSGSASSSSEGSPVGRLNASIGAISLSPEPDRGRDRATTPIQLTVPPDAQWDVLLAPGEKLVFHAPVELKSRTRRLTATLLPIPATQNRPKMRHLVLTTHRLVCAKVKRGRKVSIKSEVLLRSPGALKESKDDKREKDKDRDTRPVITSVNPKGQRAFVIMTTAKPQQFATEPPMVQKWIEEISRSIKPNDGRQDPSNAGGSKSTPQPIVNGQPARN